MRLLPRDSICAFIPNSTTYNFYKTVFNRNSIDDQGLEIRASIHCARGFDNAFWSPRDKGYMVFGDGGRFDGRGWLAPTEKELQDKERGWANLSNWFTFYQLDIIGHELTHGVVQYTAALGTQQTAKKQWPEYSEASTLNEHIADCFAIMLKHYVDKTTAETGNWDIGVNFWSDQAVKLQGYTSNYLRTFRIPTDTKSPDSDPKHWDKREDFNTGEKWGLDPHVNCGIANHAFYRAALAFKGNTWEKVGKIWYDALRDDEFKLPEKQTFKGWKDLTVRYAGKHFSTQGTTILENAWKQVGL